MCLLLSRIGLYWRKFKKIFKWSYVSSAIEAGVNINYIYLKKMTVQSSPCQLVLLILLGLTLLYTYTNVALLLRIKNHETTPKQSH